jgi:hypothetical protein
VGLAEGVALFQNRLPREPGLVDFEHQALEKLVVIGDRQAVLIVMIRTVNRMPFCEFAIAHVLLTEMCG